MRRAEERLTETTEERRGEDEVAGAHEVVEAEPGIEHDNRRRRRPHNKAIGDVPIFQMHSIADIRVGERHRRELGDVDALAASIKDVGLLHPIVIAPDGALVAGQRRVEACKRLGWTHIPVTVVYLDGENVRGEFAENAVRKDFTLSEAVAIKRALEPIERAKAKERQAAAGPISGRGAKPTGGAKSAQAVNGKTRDRLAALTGVKRTTLAKAEAIVDAVEAEPEKFGKLKEDMDKSGRVDGPFKRLQTMKAAEQIRKEPPPLPGNGPYRAGVFDCAWAAEPDDDDPDRLERGYYPYPTMTPAQFADFCSVDAANILHDDFVGAFWITNFHLVRGDHLQALAILNLKPVTLLTWRKNMLGRGQVARGTTEHIIIARRGNTVIETFPRTDFEWPVDRKHHSRKPRAFFDLFAKHVAAPRYVSFFETVDRGPLWDGHGDKVANATKLSERRNELGKHAARPVKQDHP
ncbi:MAG: ParB N-terminal domain-containing protein [Xanthobacteraceae bacterium]